MTSQSRITTTAPTRTSAEAATAPVAPTLVLGGTGRTGRRVASRLAERGLPVRIGSRRAEVPFHWEDPDSWTPVLAGVRSAYIAYHPDLALPGAAETIGALARRAADSGVQRLVLLSGRGEDGARAAEDALRRAGTDWTVLRANWFQQNFSENFFRDSVLDGEIVVPTAGTPDAVEPFVDAEDIADAAVAALIEDGHSGRVYELSGPRLLSFHDIAEELSAASGRTVRYRPVSTEEYRAGLAALGLPEELADLFTLILDGRNAQVTDGVRQALGREPGDFTDYARAAAATGAWSQ